MPASDPSITSGPAPSTSVRWLVSAAIVAHFFAISTAVLSYSTVNFPAPRLAVLANEPIQPYLQFVFLNNAYRFFAPNPGTPTVFWFRVQYEDGNVCWIETPGAANPLIRGAYQRRLNHAIQLGQQLIPDPNHEDKRILAPMGIVYMQSAVRHIARSEARHVNGRLLSVKSVGVYVLHHTVITPEQVRAGWESVDLRTYHATFVGAYTAEGRRIDEFQPELRIQPICHVAAGILQIDVYPHLRAHAGDRGNRAARLSLPTPIHRLLTKHPELLEPTASGIALHERIDKLVGQ